MTYRKSIKITKNIRLNIGKKTFSFTFIKKGFTITINSKGRISTAHNIPEIVQETLKQPKEKKKEDSQEDSTQESQKSIGNER